MSHRHLLPFVLVAGGLTTWSFAEDIPKGTVTKFEFSGSKIFPGTVRDVWVYVPKQYDGSTPACVYVNQDGMLQGPNLQLLRDVCAATERPVVASGGVTTLEDIRALMELVDLGVEGAIAGTALYEGRFTLEDALELTRS